ncbi:MAG TPA: hydroxyacid dehydrogenase [Lentisphaeria bacterium]|nr:MAG: hypothetical protein A2X48_22130 [Lentisphaerae bacterium GWF2_49_21]HBC88986.1 hydroxyacid dehydrogenase [Lentisphaeria bacterium]
MKILIADSFESNGVELLKKVFGPLNVVQESSLKGDSLRDAVSKYDVIVVRSNKLTKDIIYAASNVKLIVRSGAGVDNIDVVAASEHGIYVSNCPGKNADAVAELTIGLMIALDRRIVENVVDLRAGVWNKKEYSKADGLAGKTIGIAGFGSIGRAVAERAKGMKMKVVAWSRSLTPEDAKAAGVEFAPDLVSLARSSDVLSLHIAGSSGTSNIINKEVLSALPGNAILINTARAGILDHVALREAVAQKKLRVALDVYPNEPGSNDKQFNDEIIFLPGLLGTHHIGASTDQAQRAIAEEAVRIIIEFKETGNVLNCVNLCKKSPAVADLIVRHYDRVGVLADVLTALKQANINVQDMSNIIFEGTKAACAHLHLDTFPDEVLLKRIKESNISIIQVESIILNQKQELSASPNV